MADQYDLSFPTDPLWETVNELRARGDEELAKRLEDSLLQREIQRGDKLELTAYTATKDSITGFHVEGNAAPVLWLLLGAGLGGAAGYALAKWLEGATVEETQNKELPVSRPAPNKKPSVKKKNR